MTAKKLNEVVALLDRYYAAYLAANGVPCPFRLLRRGAFFYKGDEKKPLCSGVKSLAAAVKRLEGRAYWLKMMTQGRQSEAVAVESHQLCKELHAAFELNHNVLRLSLDKLRRMAAILKEKQ
jgi:hypothetical protein